MGQFKITDGIYKYAIYMGSGVTIYIPSFMKSSSGIPKCYGGYIYSLSHSSIHLQAEQCDITISFK
jgi:hypothetical protein